jgi:hypothetical protein
LVALRLQVSGLVLLGALTQRVVLLLDVSLLL